MTASTLALQALGLSLGLRGTKTVKGAWAGNESVQEQSGNPRKQTATRSLSAPSVSMFQQTYRIGRHSSSQMCRDTWPRIWKDEGADSETWRSRICAAALSKHTAYQHSINLCVLQQWMVLYWYAEKISEK